MEVENDNKSSFGHYNFQRRHKSFNMYEVRMYVCIYREGGEGESTTRTPLFQVTYFKP